MSTENVVKALRALWRTDRIIADIRLKHLLVSLGLRAFAALIAAFGLLMLELAAYFALVQIWSAISAAAVLGLVNFVIAAVLFVLAGRPPSGRELELASEIHGSAVDTLQIEARAAQAQVRAALERNAMDRKPSGTTGIWEKRGRKRQGASGPGRRCPRRGAPGITGGITGASAA